MDNKLTLEYLFKRWFTLGSKAQNAVRNSYYEHEIADVITYMQNIHHIRIERHMKLDDIMALQKLNNLK